MAVISDVSIANSALIKLGASRILSFSDDSKNSRLCQEQYPKLRDDLLRMHPWNFAITRVELAASTYVPAYEYGNAFVIPSDVLRILSTDLNYQPSTVEVNWAVETDPSTGARVLVTDSSAVIIRYIKNVKEGTFTDDFAETLAWALAADLAYALTQSVSLLQSMDAKYREKLREARSYDAQESNIRQVEANEWLLTRF